MIAMVPARVGSERLRFKNLRLLSGKPVIQHAIDAAKEAAIFEEIWINSDDGVFGKLAGRCDVEFYQRPPELGSSETKSDDVVADFMEHVSGDVLVWVNPIAPLQPADEIREVVGYFIEHKLDSLITVKNEHVHGLYESVPINFSYESQFAKTQDLIPVQLFVYSLMMWRYDTFMAHYRDHGFALLSGKTGYYPVSWESSVILKYEEDLRMAESILRTQSREGIDKPEFDPLINEIDPGG